ncbi:MAG: hypothetical protein ACR2J4_09975 [Deinococcus sp.]
MKKLLLGLSVLALSSSAVAATQLGAYLFGVQYRRDGGLRYGLGLPATSVLTGLNLSGDASYLRPLSGAASGVFSPYYGFGLGAGVSLGGGAGFSLYPNVLVGADISTGSAFTPFLEGSLGPSLSLGSGSGLKLKVGYGLRLGVNYRLP